MTLRLRLVLALMVLLTAGLALFGAGTYFRYRQSQYDQLDAQILDRASGRHVVFTPLGLDLIERARSALA